MYFSQCVCVCGAQVQEEQYQRWPKMFSELHKEEGGRGVAILVGGRQPKRETLLSEAASGGLSALKSGWVVRRRPSGRS